MNASEARRAALTAAVAWCRTPDGMELSTDAMLAYAAQFETWLTRPTSVDTVHGEGDAGVASSTHQPWTSLWPTSTPTRTRPNPYCTVCEHSPHAGPTCTECACTGYPTCTCTDHWHVHGSAPGLGCTVCECTTPVKAQSTARVHGDVAGVDACVCTFRSSHTACSSCGHDAHDPGDCASTQVYAAPEPVVTVHDPVVDAPCTVCAHDEHDQRACTRCGCLASRVVRSTATEPGVTVHDPIVDAPCTGFRAGMADSSYGCAHARMAHGPRGCSVTGCRCERAEGPRVVHEPDTFLCTFETVYANCPGCRCERDMDGPEPDMDGPEPVTCTCTFQTVYRRCPGCGHDRHEPGHCPATMCGPVTPR